MMNQGDTPQSYNPVPDHHHGHDDAAEGRARLQAFVQTAILLGLYFYIANLVFRSWFDGQKADIVGFVVRPPDIPKGDFPAARFVMYHCPVDAQGVAMLVN